MRPSNTRAGRSSKLCELALPMEAVRSVFGDHFEVPSAPTIERDGYVALACRRTATALSTSALSESAVQ